MAALRGSLAPPTPARRAGQDTAPAVSGIQLSPAPVVAEAVETRHPEPAGDIYRFLPKDDKAPAPTFKPSSRTICLKILPRKSNDRNGRKAKTKSWLWPVQVLGDAILGFLTALLDFLRDVPPRLLWLLVVLVIIAVTMGLLAMSCRGVVSEVSQDAHRSPHPLNWWNVGTSCGDGAQRPWPSCVIAGVIGRGASPAGRRRTCGSEASESPPPLLTIWPEPTDGQCCRRSLTSSKGTR